MNHRTKILAISSSLLWFASNAHACTVFTISTPSQALLGNNEDFYKQALFHSSQVVRGDWVESTLDFAMALESLKSSHRGA